MKTALVTGAARGIGLATTRLFLEEGWQVAMIDRDAPALEAELFAYARGPAERVAGGEHHAHRVAEIAAGTVAAVSAVPV